MLTIGQETSAFCGSFDNNPRATVGQASFSRYSPDFIKFENVKNVKSLSELWWTNENLNGYLFVIYPVFKERMLLWHSCPIAWSILSVLSVGDSCKYKYTPPQIYGTQQVFKAENQLETFSSSPPTSQIVADGKCALEVDEDPWSVGSPTHWRIALHYLPKSASIAQWWSSWEHSVH